MSPQNALAAQGFVQMDDYYSVFGHDFVTGYIWQPRPNALQDGGIPKFNRLTIYQDMCGRLEYAANVRTIQDEI
jgi:hypothetical protein